MLWGRETISVIESQVSGLFIPNNVPQGGDENLELVQIFPISNRILFVFNFNICLMLLAGLNVEQQMYFIFLLCSWPHQSYKKWDFERFYFHLYVVSYLRYWCSH